MSCAVRPFARGTIIGRERGEEQRMAWTLKGHMTENCSCNMFCPCWFAVREYMIMDQGWCAGSLTFEIDEGASDGVDLSGRIVTVLIDFPGPTLFDGNATGRVFLDDEASDDQARELAAIFQGQSGGTMGMLGSLVSSWLPVEKTSIRVSRDGDVIRTHVGSVGQVSSRALRDDQGSGFTMRGGGFVGAFGMEEAELAPSVGTTWSDPDMPRVFETKSGARGMVNMSGG
jgi:hypothetical protein